MDKIILQDLPFYAYHGCFEEEREQGQTFLVTLMMETTAVPAAAAADNLTQTVDCGAVYEATRAVVVEHRFQLLETLAEEIARRLLAEFVLIERLTVRVDKPRAPGKDGCFHSAVEIVRER